MVARYRGLRRSKDLAKTERVPPATQWEDILVVLNTLVVLNILVVLNCVTLPRVYGGALLRGSPPTLPPACLRSVRAVRARQLRRSLPARQQTSRAVLGHGRWPWRTSGQNSTGSDAGIERGGSNGDLGYRTKPLANDYNDCMAAIDPQTGALGWQYGQTGDPGTAAGLLSTPDGFDILGPGGATPTHPATG